MTVLNLEPDNIKLLLPRSLLRAPLLVIWAKSSCLRAGRGYLVRSSGVPEPPDGGELALVELAGVGGEEETEDTLPCRYRSLSPGGIAPAGKNIF